MGIYLLAISLCSLVIQIHREDDMILDFKQVSIPTKILILGVLIWFTILIFMDRFFISPITLNSLELFIDDIWLIFLIVLGLSWIVVENIYKRPIRIVKSEKAKKYLISILRVIGILVVLLYFLIGFI